MLSISDYSLKPARFSSTELVLVQFHIFQALSHNTFIFWKINSHLMLCFKKHGLTLLVLPTWRFSGSLGYNFSKQQLATNLATFRTNIPIIAQCEGALSFAAGDLSLALLRSIKASSPVSCFRIYSVVFVMLWTFELCRKKWMNVWELNEEE